jgi:hypothetical protein
MPDTRISSGDFNQDGRAKLAADEGPVIITDRGEPAYVLMTHGIPALDRERVPLSASFWNRLGRVMSWIST